jgi:hypothetical protein
MLRVIMLSVVAPLISPATSMTKKSLNKLISAVLLGFSVFTNACFVYYDQDNLILNFKKPEILK